jgi:hypothetical protein
MMGYFFYIGWKQEGYLSCHIPPSGFFLNEGGMWKWEIREFGGG